MTARPSRGSFRLTVTTSAHSALQAVLGVAEGAVWSD